MPHGLNGKPLPNLGGGPFNITLSDACTDVQVQRSFSNKPKATGKYKDHFHKIETYVSFISGPAMQKLNATPYTYNASEEALDDPVFKFRDTLTSRSNITDLSQKFTEDVIAVIGLGGTGAYVLDFMVKTPLKKYVGLIMTIIMCTMLTALQVN
nr:DUF6791 domain-containing protein [Oceanicoccus sp. KOV_DT_Chl]